MDKKKKRVSKANPNQLNLFDLIKKVSKAEKELVTTAGSFNIDIRLRHMISDALKACPLSRDMVAARMNELLGMEISKSQLNSWTAESRDQHRFPLVYAAAFCEATGNVNILRIVVEMTGCYLIQGEDALLTELGRIEKMKEEIAKKEKLVRQTLAELGVKNGS